MFHPKYQSTDESQSDTDALTDSDSENERKLPLKGDDRRSAYIRAHAPWIKRRPTYRHPVVRTFLRTDRRVRLIKHTSGEYVL